MLTASGICTASTRMPRTLKVGVVFVESALGGASVACIEVSGQWQAVSLFTLLFAYAAYGREQQVPPLRFPSLRERKAAVGMTECLSVTEYLGYGRLVLAPGREQLGTGDWS